MKRQLLKITLQTILAGICLIMAVLLSGPVFYWQDQSPDGLNHGGLTEEQQGQGIVRMMQAIEREGYAGALIFEWMDEWAKKTWSTEPYMIPYERHVFWHNAIDPEQNYGLLSYEPEMAADQPVVVKGEGSIRRIAVRHDAAFLYVDVEFAAQPDFSKEKLLIGLDTYDRGRGEMKFSPHMNVSAPGGLEFLLEFDAQDSRLLVHPGYNTAKSRYSSFASSQGVFEEIRPLIHEVRVSKDGTPIAAQYEDASRLNYGDFNANSYNHWYWEASLLHIRLPWGRLNFSDPSSLMVLDDNSGAEELVRDQLKTTRTEGIVVSALYCDAAEQQKIDLLSTSAYNWQPWEVTAYRERLKQSYYILQELLR